MSCCRCRCPRRSTIAFAEEMAPPAPAALCACRSARRSLIGVVWDEAEDERGVELAADRLRTIDETLPLPPLASSLRRFVDRVAAYTMTPPGAVLRMSMSVVEALQPLRPRRLCTISPAGLAALADAGPGPPLTRRAPQRARNPARQRRPCRSPMPLGLPAAGPVSCATSSARGLAEERLVPAEPPAIRRRLIGRPRVSRFPMTRPPPRVGSSPVSRTAAFR